MASVIRHNESFTIPAGEQASCLSVARTGQSANDGYLLPAPQVYDNALDYNADTPKKRSTLRVGRLLPNVAFARAVGEPMTNVGFGAFATVTDKAVAYPRHHHMLAYH